MSRTDSGIRVNKEARDDFMAQKPANITSSQYIRLLLLLWEEKKRAATPFSGNKPIHIEGEPDLVPYEGVICGPDTDIDRAIVAKVTGTCLGRPKGAKDLKPRKPRQKRLPLKEKREKVAVT